MDDLKLDLNHTYLLRYGCTDTVHSITILMITNEAYKIRWNGGSGSETWELKRRVYADYSLVEDISDYLVPIVPKPEDFKFHHEFDFDNIKWHPYFLVEETCKVCGGFGKVHNTNTTSCYKLCPACNGSGKESKKVKILFD